MKHLLSMGLVGAAMVGMGAATTSAAPLSPSVASLAAAKPVELVQYQLHYRSRNQGNRRGTIRSRSRNYAKPAVGYGYRGGTYGFAGERYVDRVWSYGNFGGSYGYLGSYGYSHQYYGSRPD